MKSARDVAQEYDNAGLLASLGVATLAETIQQAREDGARWALGEIAHKCRLDVQTLALIGRLVSPGDARKASP